MEDFLQGIQEYLFKIANKYGGFVVGGLIGAIIQRIRHTMNFKTFLGVLATSAFVGFCVGVTVKYYLNLPEEVVFVTCSLSGVFSKDILDEIQKVISYISVFIKKYIGNKTNNETQNY